MKYLNTFAGLIAPVVLICLSCFGINHRAYAQGCNQVEISYQEPDCFKSKGPNGSAGSPNSDRNCLPVTVCAEQQYTYSAAGGPWSSYLWAVTSGPASPAINPNATSANANIIWPLPGTYVLTLTVTDGSGNTFTKCLTVTVKDKPAAGFTFSPNGACAPAGVSFTNTTTFAGTTFYSWDFGDPASGANNTSALANPTHVYNAAGTYTVTLIAYSGMMVPSGGGSTGSPGDSLSLVTCCADTFTQTVTIVNGNLSIQCISTVCAGAISKYTAVGCTTPTWLPPLGGTILSTSGNTVTVQWGNGSVQGQLAVTCGGSCTAYAAVPIVPSSPVITGPTTPCTTGVSTYTVPYLPGTYYTWTLTDITTSTPANNLLSTYPDNNAAVINWAAAIPGSNYLLTINLDNKHLCCTSSASLTIIPKPSFSLFGPATICQGQTETFSPFPSGTFNWTASPATGVTPPTATGTGFYSAVFGNSGNYVITATNTSGAFCNTTATANATVISVPVPGIIQGPGTACAGSQYNYNMSTPAPAGYFYEWTITNGTFEPGALTTTTGDNVTVLWTSLSGTITVQLRQSASPFCIIPAGSITITQATVGSVLGPTSACVDGTASYTLSGVPAGTSVTWSILPSAGLGTIISGQDTTTATVLWHGAGGAGPWGPVTVNAVTTCGSAASGPVTVYPKFTVGITPSAGDICQPAGVTLSVSGAPSGATYSWSPGGAATPSINVTSAGSHTVTVTAGGCSAVKTITVPDPFAIVPVTCGVGTCDAAGNTNEQLGVQVIKPPVGTFTYTWRNGTCNAPGSIITSAASGLLSDSYLATTHGNYNAVVSYGNCQKCVDFVVKKVCCPDVNQPQITAKTQLSCDTWKFTGITPNPAGATITWDFGDGTTAPGASGVPIQHTYSLAGKYCVTFCVGPPTPNPTACTGNCAATEAIVPLAAAFTYTLGCNGCVNVTNNSLVFGGGTVSYAWDFGDGFTTAGASPPQHCYVTGGPYTITLTATYTDPSVPITCIKTAQQTLTYTPLSITNNAPVCTGTPVSFASSPGGFVTYSWNFGDGFTGYTSPILHAYNTSGPYNVTLAVTDVLGNTCNASTSFTVLSGINSCTIQPGYICPGSTATLTAPAGSYTYLWEVETSPNVFIPAPGTNSGSTYNTAVTGNYHVIVTNANGCSCTSNTVAVTQVAKPKATFSISPKKNLCAPGDLVTLTAPAVTGFTYDWYINGAYGSPVSSGPTFVAFVSSTATYNLIITNQYGCKDTCSQTIIVAPNPPPPGITSTGFCAGVPITLSVTNYSSNITWNTGANTTSIIVQAAGTYVATVTNPATGCSSSSSITINRRPSAGLFPHHCDSIPCKCSRPFVIYAPNPLSGNFASGYTVNWYDGISNALLFTGNPYSNGSLGVQTGSYYVVITDQTTGCKDTSNKYAVTVPPCDTCDCKGSSWGEMLLSTGGANPLFPHCGKTDTIQCNKPYTFTTNYNCSTGCTGKVTYSLQPPSGAAITGNAPVSLTPTVSGTYTLTLYGWCGTKICDSCVIKLVVICPPCDCKGSKWNNIVLTQGGLDEGGKAIIGTAQTLKCGKSYKLECNKPYNLNASFSCKDSLCPPKVTYLLKPPTGPAITGNAPLSFTPTQTGTYTLTLYGWCGSKICDSCVIKLDIVCGCDCAGSKWDDIILTQDAGDNPAGAGSLQKLKCGKTYDVDCKKTFSINASFLCKDTACKGKVTYVLQPPTGTAVTGALPISMTPSITGTYTLTLYGWCGDKICDSCVIKFKVDCSCDCKGSKWGEKTLSNGNTSTTLSCKSYEWNCNQPFTINASYICAKPYCTGTTSYKLIPASDPIITGTLPLTYTPTVSGSYIVVLYGYCGGQLCDSCVTTFKVPDCPPKDTICCKYPIRIQPGTPTYAVTTGGSATIATQSFTISGLTGVLLSEVRAQVLSYDISSNFNNECLACKMQPYLWASINTAGSIGSVPGLITMYGGATAASFNPTGAAVYQNPREVVWNNGTPFSIAGPVSMKFFLPPPPLIDCCELRGRICVKFTFRDMSCNECELIVCFDVVVKK